MKITIDEKGRSVTEPTAKERAMLTVSLFGFDYIMRIAYDGDMMTAAEATRLIDALLKTLDIEEEYRELLTIRSELERG